MRFKTQKLLFFLLLTRVLILILPWLTITLLFPESTHLNLWQFTQISWSRWDAGHYLYLAQHWYTSIGDEANFIVFYPLYPLILKPIIFLTQDAAISGIILSTMLFITGAYFFYELLKLDYSERVARASVILLAIFPTSYFFNSPYTESLFLLVFSLSFYLARKGEWVFVGIITALGCLTRPFGLLILPSILFEWFITKDRKWKSLPIIVLPSILAMIGYLYINKTIYGDFFMFQKILADHWQKHLMSPILSIKDTWNIALSGGLNSYTIMIGWAEAITITIAWILIPFVFKYLRKSWAIYYTLSIILFSSTSFILSTPRYMLSIPPFFVLLALAEKNYLFKITWRFTSVAILFCLAILFARGQWAF